MLRLEQPEFFLLLLILPLWIAIRVFSKKTPALGFSGLALFETIRNRGRMGWLWLPPVLKAACLFLLALALAKPVWEEEHLSTKQEGIEILVLVDRSSSMSEPVLDQDRSNLDVVRDAIKGFLKDRRSDRIGLIAFARFPTIVCPLTQDVRAVEGFLDSLACVPQGAKEDGTAIGAALAEAARIFDTEEGERAVILLTDGEENRYIVDPWAAARLLRDQGVKVYAVAAAGRDGEGGAISFPRGTFHEDLARITQGLGRRVSTSEDLKEVVKEIDALEKRPMESIPFRERSDLFRWFLWPSALLVLFEFLVTRTILLRLP